MAHINFFFVLFPFSYFRFVRLTVIFGAFSAQVKTVFVVFLSFTAQTLNQKWKKDWQVFSHQKQKSFSHKVKMRRHFSMPKSQPMIFHIFSFVRCFHNEKAFNSVFRVNACVRAHTAGFVCELEKFVTKWWPLNRDGFSAARQKTEKEKTRKVRTLNWRQSSELFTIKSKPTERWYAKAKRFVETTVSSAQSASNLKCWQNLYVPKYFSYFFFLFLKSKESQKWTQIQRNEENALHEIRFENYVIVFHLDFKVHFVPNRDIEKWKRRRMATFKSKCISRSAFLFLSVHFVLLLVLFLSWTRIE